MCASYAKGTTGGSGSDEGGAGRLVDKKVLRKIIKDFTVSSTVKNVAKEHLLRGEYHLIW